ncbi:hypothetical protein N0V93_006673 [Gnomoniopsis smithogilvyi]|uniref:MARVEL domain-containing protein n=1 Tax=Gnomoniopsis smithogilvyi TaxID=1191159 RepID=A0A9W9CVV5_9PEZI|nr:hypothetical protein N0V93_006673 [Gnomoniopsis smithogilvyi]
MGAKAGFTLKLIQWFNRGVQFACCGLILALTAYFLAAMSNNNITIPTNLRAVAGISGIGVIYTALGVLLVCCLAGFTLTSFLAIVLDIAFIGAFIYVATVYKDGASSCSGSNVNTVFGSGNADVRITSADEGGVALPTYRTACRMESANLAVAIVAIVFFIISALTEFGLGRHRKKEQRFGPSPANNYTGGYGKKSKGFGSLFKRRGTNKTVDDPNALPMHTEPDQLHRQSYTTDATHVDGHGSTTTGYPKYGEAGYAEPGAVPPAGATVNGFGNVPGYSKPAGRYGDGTYNV